MIPSLGAESHLPPILLIPQYRNQVVKLLIYCRKQYIRQLICNKILVILCDM